MKTSILTRFGQLLFLAAIFSFSFAFTAPVSFSETLEENPPRWEKLGQRKVNYGVDRDEILVTAREGRFTAVKLMVRQSPINMHKMVIHFHNGDKQDVNLRNKIPAGGATRVVDLQGGKRIVKKVIFWYDTKGILKKRATIELWGRH